MSKVYSIIEFQSVKDKEVVVEYLLEGEENGDVPDIAMSSHHSVRELAREVEKMEHREAADVFAEEMNKVEVNDGYKNQPESV